MNRQRIDCIIVFCGLILTAIPSHAQQQESQEQQIELLIQQLSTQATQEEAIAGLVAVGAPAVRALIEMALSGPSPFPVFPDIPADPDMAPRRAAWKALISIGEPAVPHLIEACGDEDRMFGTNASSVLRDIGELAKPYLLSAMEHENVLVRRRVVGLLTTLHNPPVPVLLKALRGKDRQVQDSVILMFTGSHDYLDDISAVDISAVAGAMLEILDYEHPHRNNNAILPLLKIGEQLRLAIALRSPKWSVRFGVAEAYVYAWNDAYQPTSRYCAGPLPPEVIPNLIAGLNKGLERGDTSLCETAVRALKRLGLAEYHARQTLNNIYEAKKALKAFPPPVILESSVKEGDNAVDSTALNQEGIYFRFNNYIYDATASIIRLDVRPQYPPLARGVPFSRLKGKILEWEIQQESSYELKMVPRLGNELVSNAVYQIELSVIDLYGNQLTQQIQFITAKTED